MPPAYIDNVERWGFERLAGVHARCRPRDEARSGDVVKLCEEQFDDCFQAFPQLYIIQ